MLPRAALRAARRPLVGRLVRVQPPDRVDHPRAILLALLLLALERLEETRLHDDAARLRRDRAQESELVRRETPAPERLHDEHTERTTPLRDRHAEKRMVTLLTGLR